MRTPIVLVFGLVIAATAASAQHVSGVLDYTTHPLLTSEFFRGQQRADSTSTFRPQIQYGALDAGMQFQEAGPIWTARALAFSRANSVHASADSAAVMLYFQAMWHIAGYHAAVLESRLRRGIPPRGMFDLKPDATYKAEAINAGVLAEWRAVTDALTAETDNGQDPLRTLAFVDEYRRAVDTVFIPQLALGPHGRSCISPLVRRSRSGACVRGSRPPSVRTSGWATSTIAGWPCCTSDSCTRRCRDRPTYPRPS